MRWIVVLLLSLTCALSGCSTSYRVGEEVMVEWEGKEYPAVVLAVDGPTRYKVHYLDYEEAWDETVSKSRIKGKRHGDEPKPEPPAKVRQKAVQAAQTNTYRVGDRVRVVWNDGRYYPAQVVDIVGKELYRVHYEGYGPEWDENVALNRVQAR